MEAANDRERSNVSPSGAPFCVLRDLPLRVACLPWRPDDHLFRSRLRAALPLKPLRLGRRSDTPFRLRRKRPEAV